MTQYNLTFYKRTIDFINNNLLLNNFLNENQNPDFDFDIYY